MIKRFIRRVFGLREDVPLRIPRSKHGLPREAISHGALKVCDVLQDAGFSAYVVGGAVRDLLLDIEPKDFDVATDARPEQIKPLFRRALIIGRRFRLVHVMVGRETVETSTFRAAIEEAAEPGGAQGEAQQLHDDGRGVDPADALPLYLRDKVALTTRERDAARGAGR